MSEKEESLEDAGPSSSPVVVEGASVAAALPRAESPKEVPPDEASTGTESDSSDHAKGVSFHVQSMGSKHRKRKRMGTTGMAAEAVVQDFDSEEDSDDGPPKRMSMDTASDLSSDLDMEETEPDSSLGSESESDFEESIDPIPSSQNPTTPAPPTQTPTPAQPEPLPNKQEPLPEKPAPHQQQPEGWRVKLYRLNADGSWDDCGTGRILCLYKKGASNNHTDNLTGDASIYHILGEPTLCMHSEVAYKPGEPTPSPRILLRTRILLRDAYQRQGDNIITWCEPYLEEGSPVQGVDLALSFQDNAGCLEVWRQITRVQANAAELSRRNGTDNGRASNEARLGQPKSSMQGKHKEDSVQDMAHAAAAAHHADLQRQQQEEMWADVAETAQRSHTHHNPLVGRDNDVGDQFMACYSPGGGQHMVSNVPQSPPLPEPPMLQNLEEIADTVASIQHIQQRDSLAGFISQNDCAYLKSLLALFPSAESNADVRALATLAACVKAILLLNETSVIELVVTDERVFEDMCAALEYDTDLREKANHRWFLRERLKFRTVVLMEDEGLINAIHRSFRVEYILETLLRPTMDEGSLSTLSSLQTFTHADVIKGVTMGPSNSTQNRGALNDSYLAKIIRVLGTELEIVGRMEWDELESSLMGSDAEKVAPMEVLEAKQEVPSNASADTTETAKPKSSIWRQHLVPQDGSLASRKIRLWGCLAFLKELFDMAKKSLEQGDRDDFVSVLVSLEVELSDNKSQDTAANAEGQVNDAIPKSVNLLNILAKVLTDPSMNLSEKGAALEVVSTVVAYCPDLVRRRCLDQYTTRKELEQTGQSAFATLTRPNEKREVVLPCPQDDVLLSLLSLLAIDEDPGLLLQVSEILKFILDMEVLGDQENGLGDEKSGQISLLQPVTTDPETQSSNATLNAERNQFLSMFYDYYLQWCVAPFQYKIFCPSRRIPDHVLENPSSSPLLLRILDEFGKGQCDDEPSLRVVPKSSTRSSFAIEILSFLVRAHLYRMKSYLLRSRMLGIVLKCLKKPVSNEDGTSSRTLKLAALRFLRSVVSVKDEYYHRHIIQHDLFTPVFEAFKENPVGDNLLSSVIVDMCDFIRREKLKSLIDHIVTKHLNSTDPGPSLEEVSKPYVTTFVLLRAAYDGMQNDTGIPATNSMDTASIGPHSPVRFNGKVARKSPLVLNDRAREDQRKFHEADHEESYFDSDDDDGVNLHTSVPSAVDEVEAAHELHPPPRHFDLSHVPILNHGQKQEVKHESPSTEKTIPDASSP
eukprot:Nitzschia sp. Nitz4//scaffold13_size275219//163460//167406//NITZ4_000886-RA/size275219-augustus-gene-0.266-mRNA-1//-1//CDS//3329536050//4418//frame0